MYLVDLVGGYCLVGGTLLLIWLCEDFFGLICLFREDYYSMGGFHCLRVLAAFCVMAVFQCLV